MKRFHAVLTLAMLAGSMIASTGGCARATSEPPPAPRGAVSYCANGWLLDASAADVLKIADEPNRLAAFHARAARLQRVFLVPAPAFEWLFKRAASARRAQDEAADSAGQ